MSLYNYITPSKRGLGSKSLTASTNAKHASIDWNLISRPRDKLAHHHRE